MTGDKLSGTVTSSSASQGSYSYANSTCTPSFTTANGISNYTVSYTLAQTINKAPLLIEINDTKVYDGTPLVTDYTEATATGLQNGATLNAGVVTTPSKDVAVYTDNTGANITTDFATSDGISNYNVTYAFTQEITKRPVTLTSATDSREYNGNWLTNHNVTVSGQGWVTGEGATYDVTGKQLLPGTSDNTFTYTLNSNTLASNYDITVVYGTLTVTNRTTPYEVTMTSKSNTSPITYDGLEHNVNGFVTNTFTTVDGNTYTVEGLSASVTEIFAGTYPNTITGTPVVRDAYGNDVTDQFTVNQVPGTLTIGKRPISFTIAADDASKVYDGTPLTVDYSLLIVSGLASTDQLIAGTITTNDFVVGDYPITDGNMFRMMAEKYSTKSGFSIKHSSGELARALASYSPTFTITLRITLRPLTLAADDATKVYDGTPLTKNSFTVTSTLGSGDAVSATVNGSQTCVDESANVIDATSVQVMHDNGDGTYRDVTSNYSPVTLTDGLLKVTPITTGFSCPTTVTLTLTEGTSEMTVSDADLGGTAMLTPANTHTHVGNNLASLNPMTEDTYTVTWTLYDDCDSAMTTCDQMVIVQYAPCEGVTDYHGHTYDAVRIGHQCWLAEDLRWATGDYHTYNEDPANLDKFGYLYSWYTAVNVTEGNVNATPETSIADDGTTYVQGICPAGWAVPSQSDVEALGLNVGTVSTLKDPSTLYWMPGFEGVNPGTGFDARGGGRYNAALGRYEDLRTGYHFWESDAQAGTTSVLSACIAYYCDTVLFAQPNQKNDRKSVRCVRKVVTP